MQRVGVYTVFVYLKPHGASHINIGGSPVINMVIMNLVVLKFVLMLHPTSIQAPIQVQ
jgi:hypothetical protein